MAANRIHSHNKEHIVNKPLAHAVIDPERISYRAVHSLAATHFNLYA